MGSVGFAFESSAGTPNTTSDVYLPYTANSLRGHHEPIEEISAKTARHMDKGSVIGKKWAEGDLSIDLDVVNSGYLFKMALGSELLATGTPNTHTFFTTVSGNTPKTATLIYSRGDTDIEQYAFSSCDQLDI